MYSCPNCGSNIKFKIETQDMYCEYCNTHHNPYSFTKDTDALESEYFDLTIFTCPQCGGELVSADEEATAYCSYCGSSNILTSRLKKKKMPKYIIPFKVTKDNCIEIYKSKMKNALFSPNKAKSDKCINNIRAIYMPYYLYHISQNGGLVLKGEKIQKSGDDIFVDTVLISGDVKSDFPSIPYEASALFFDSLSQRIEPYDLSKKMKFSPAYLSGFYADIADVDPFVYENDAIEEANECTIERIELENRISNIKTSNPNIKSNISKQIHTECTDIETAYFPVWLFSYKHGKKVSYAAINGQNGKIAADMPISITKYIGFSLFAAVFFALILWLFRSFSPSTFLSFFAFLVVLSNNMLINNMIDTVKKEQSYKDKGIIWKSSGKVLEKNEMNIQKRNFGIGKFIFMCLISPASIIVLLQILSLIDWVIIGGGAIYCFFRGNALVDYRCKSKGFASIFLALIASVIAALILYSDMNYEWIYLVGDIICFIAMISMIAEMIRGLILTDNRKLAHFQRGGR